MPRNVLTAENIVRDHDGRFYISECHDRRNADGCWGADFTIAGNQAGYATFAEAEVAMNTLQFRRMMAPIDADATAWRNSTPA